MKYGAFDIFEKDRLEEILNEKKIPYTISLDETLITQPPSERTYLEVSSRGPRRNLPKFVYFEIRPADIIPHSELLARFGICAPTDREPAFDVQDWICPKCRFCSDQPGICPDHQIDLILWEKRVEKSRNQLQVWNRRAAQFGLCALASLIFYIIYLKLER